MIAIPERLKRPLEWTGYPVFASFVALTAFYATLPRDRIQERVEAAASEALNIKVSSQDFGLTLLAGPGVTASDVRIETRPTNPTDKPTIVRLDDVTLRSGLFALLRGHTDVTFKTHFARGKVSGRYRSAPDEGTLVTEAVNVGLGALPPVSNLIGIPNLPMDGTLDLEVDVTAPKNLMAESVGTVQLKLLGGVIGDGKAKLVIPGNPVLGDGITLPKVQIGTLEGGVTIEKGRAQLHGVKSHSPDLDLELQGYIELRDPLSLSQLHLYLLLKPSEALLKREASVEAMVTVGGALARRPDGFFGIAMSGPASSPLVLASRDTPPGLTPSKPTPGRGGLPKPLAGAVRPIPPPPLPLPRPIMPTPVAPLPSPPPSPLPSPPPASPPPSIVTAPPEPAPPPAAPAPTAQPSIAPPPPPASSGTATAQPTVTEPAGGVPPPAARGSSAVRAIMPSAPPEEAPPARNNSENSGE